TLSLMDSEQYWKAIKLLKNATHVHTMGLGISTYIAEIAAYLLKKIGIKSSAMCYGGFTFMQSIIDMPARDVILAFSFPPYSMDMIHAAAFAHKKGLKVIAVTNKVTSKIVQYSAVYLQIVVESTTVYNSMSTILTLLNALITDLADKLKLRSLKAIETAEVAEKDIHLGNTSVTGGKCHRERSVAISRGWQARQEIASSKTPRNDHP
ncbi:MAG: MurR/RpiR family transcriptional regulator, partial [bacterium]